jgi:hypothetical protein
LKGRARERERERERDGKRGIACGPTARKIYRTFCVAPQERQLFKLAAYRCSVSQLSSTAKSRTYSKRCESRRKHCTRNI